MTTFPAHRSCTHTIQLKLNQRLAQTLQRTTAYERSKALIDGVQPGPAHLYILSGIPFAGKSTLARALVQQRGFAHVDVDAIKREIAGRSGLPARVEQVNQAFAESYRLLAGLLAQGRVVVYDAANHTRASRDRARRVADAAGCRATIIYVAVAVEQAAHRRQRNRLATQRHDVADPDFAEVVSGFEPPQADEVVLVYDSAEAPDAWIERMF